MKLLKLLDLQMLMISYRKFLIYIYIFSAKLYFWSLPFTNFPHVHFFSPFCKRMAPLILTKSTHMGQVTHTPRHHGRHVDNDSHVTPTWLATYADVECKSLFTWQDTRTWHVRHLPHVRWLGQEAKIANLWKLGGQKCNLAYIFY
jgi:hypothetical protein